MRFEYQKTELLSPFMLFDQLGFETSVSILNPKRVVSPPISS